MTLLFFEVFEDCLFIHSVQECHMMCVVRIFLECPMMHVSVELSSSTVVCTRKAPGNPKHIPLQPWKCFYFCLYGLRAPFCFLYTFFLGLDLESVILESS